MTPPAPKTKKKTLIVTGLSGAGLSTALSALEDLGYETLDNFPVSMIPPLLKEQSPKKGLAIGIDTRTRGFSPDAVIRAVGDTNAHLLYLTADADVLQKRFTETRRKHPLATDRPVRDGIKKELEILYPLREAADEVLDTSELKPKDLHRMMQSRYALDAPGALTLTVMSFGYKYGVPRNADIIMDVRFLDNPHWDEALRPLTGQDADIKTFIEKDDALNPFLIAYKALLEPLLPRYSEQGKTYLTIAFGCTGGRHRSVYVAERLSRWLHETAGAAAVTLRHRDMER